MAIPTSGHYTAPPGGRQHPLHRLGVEGGGLAEGKGKPI